VLSRLKRAERDLERAERREERQRSRETPGCGELGCAVPRTRSGSSGEKKNRNRTITVPDEPTYEPCEPSQGCRRTIIIDLKNGDWSPGTRHDDD
jgi:hypothetical protein